jgi:drug/metabolite transporter (DMT)-like permease
MIAILFSILTTTFILILFKLFPKYGIHTFHAIVVNYLTAFVTGIIIYGTTLKHEQFEDLSWLPYAILCSCLFISLFLLMGRSTQKNGMALTSMSVKMSMAIALILMIIVYKEHITQLKVIGIICSLIGVYLLTYSKSNSSQKKSVGILVGLFIGCGILDFVLNFVQNNALGKLSIPLFSAFSLGFAGIIGLVFIGVKGIKKSEYPSKKSILAGIILGIPNFFSIYYLIKSYSSTNWDDSTVLAILNISTVISSTLFGYLLFKERLNSVKWVGMLISLVSIVLFYLSN